MLLCQSIASLWLPGPLRCGRCSRCGPWDVAQESGLYENHFAERVVPSLQEILLLKCVVFN